MGFVDTVDIRVQQQNNVHVANNVVDNDDNSAYKKEQLAMYLILMTASKPIFLVM